MYGKWRSGPHQNSRKECYINKDRSKKIGAPTGKEDGRPKGDQFLRGDGTSQRAGVRIFRVEKKGKADQGANLDRWNWDLGKGLSKVR